jgi:hypothetical protein
MRVFGVPIYTPQAVVSRAVSDLAAVERLVRGLPDQLQRGLAIGDELVEIGHQVLEIAERLDERAATFNDLGERLDVRAGELLELGQCIRDLGDRIDDTGAEVVERAGQVVNTAAELITLLPAMERALDLASPLGGAIDRFGRMVDRFPGAPSPRRREPPKPSDTEIIVEVTAVDAGPEQDSDSDSDAYSGTGSGSGADSGADPGADSETGQTSAETSP